MTFWREDLPMDGTDASILFYMPWLCMPHSCMISMFFLDSLNAFHYLTTNKNLKDQSLILIQSQDKLNKYIHTEQNGNCSLYETP